MEVSAWWARENETGQEREREKEGTRRYLRVACATRREAEREGSGAGACVEDVWLAVQRRRPGVPRRSFGISLTPPLIISLFFAGLGQFHSGIGNAPYKSRCLHFVSVAPTVEAGGANARVQAPTNACTRTFMHESGYGRAFLVAEKKAHHSEK